MSLEQESLLNPLKIDANKRSLVPCSQRKGAWVYLPDGHRLDFTCNDYLGVAQHPTLKEALKQGIDQFPTGSTGSRLLSGDYLHYHELEAKLADFFGFEAGLLFNSGYHVNTGVLPALCQSGDVILADKLCHASLIDGFRLSKHSFYRYRHQDYAHLETLLKRYADTPGRLWVVTESLFSMDGDYLDYEPLLALKAKYGFKLYVDDAHATGVSGLNGEGWVAQHGFQSQCDVMVGTFGKAWGLMGAYVMTDNATKERLIQHCRSLIYSTAMPPFLVTGLLAILSLMPQLSAERQHLASLSQEIRQALKQDGVSVLGDSHIVPVVTGDNESALALSLHCQRLGLQVLPIRPPTVPKGSARIRLSLSALHTQADLDQLLAALVQGKADGYC